MEPIAMLSADPLDILFENRNKDYGAYPLRKYYAQRMYISMGFTFSLAAVFALAILYFKPSGMIIFKEPLEDLHFQTVDMTPRVKTVLPPARTFAAKPPAAKSLTTPIITADALVSKPIATVDQLQNSAIAVTTSEGPVDNGNSHANGNSAENSAGPAVANGDSAETRDQVFERAEIMPEFPGGLDALKRYLQRNLRMPENQLEEGARVRVTAKFIVDAEGKVKEIEITQSAAEVFNMEVRRVIGKMPDWKPGMQNHRHVAVYFYLPVNFVNAE